LKAVILAGGLGTRLAEETVVRPKPMVKIGGLPLLWHIMKIYGRHGINDFVICLGYKGYLIKEYFANYFLHMSDVTFGLADNSMTVHQTHADPWTVTLVDTGVETMTGGRVKRAASYLSDETFLLTYGDGVGDIDVGRTIEFHRSHGKAATMTVTQPPGRFGQVQVEQDTVVRFVEKPVGDGGWVNGGFFVLEPRALEYIEGDTTVLEQEPLRDLAADGELVAYRHHGFWLPMDTLRDKQRLEDLWGSGDAPWKVWS